MPASVISSADCALGERDIYPPLRYSEYSLVPSVCVVCPLFAYSEREKAGGKSEPASHVSGKCSLAPRRGTGEKMLGEWGAE